MPRESRTHRKDGSPRAISKRRGEVRRLIPGVNDLATLFPEVASEIIDGNPSELTRGSNRKFHWKCPLGHIYLMSVSQRTSGSGCAVCAGKQIIAGVNDLASRFPKIAEEANGWDPTTVTFSSNLSKSWRCHIGHEWKANINNRSSQGMGCPYCAGRLPFPGFNDLATTHPEIAKEMYLDDPTQFTFGSGKKVQWKCREGHIWSASVSRRIRQECPTCHVRFKNIIVGVNDLATTHPEVAMQAHGWDPQTVTYGSGEKHSWICAKGHQWIAAVSKRTSKDPRNCPYCSNQKVLHGFNDLTTTHPEISKLAIGWDPSTVVAGTNSRRKWTCPKGHQYINSVNKVVAGSPCLVCVNSFVQAGVNDIQTTHPDIAKEADGWDPQTVHIGTHKKLPWVCHQGHKWSAVVKSRLKNGCPVCGNRVVEVGFNDLKTHFPQLAEEADGWDPTHYAYGTTRKMSWRCLEGHTWKSTIKNRSQLGRGCPTCATSGFDPNLDGWLYFIQHPAWEMQQIGITNFPEKRLATHRKLGWELVEIRGPLMGDVARNWETEILRVLKQSGASFTADKEQGKFTGFSESWLLKSFSATSIRQLMELVEANE